MERTEKTARQGADESGFLKVSEVFASFQGEGASAGEPSVFLRLALCNLRCAWCDTKYTWDWSQYRYDEEVKRVSIDAVLDAVGRERRNRLVVTGGEPLLQQTALTEFLQRLPASIVVEVETNGTLVPLPELIRRVDQWNVSPKLSNSGEPEARRLRFAALTALRDSGRAWLKLVIGAPSELPEADALVEKLSWPKERVLLMPQAARRKELTERTPDVREAALRRGYGFSPRLHVEQFDGARGI